MSLSPSSASLRLAAIVLVVSPLLAGTLTGCAQSRQSVDYVAAPAISTLRDLRVAVLPLENLTNYSNAGVIVADLLATELYERAVFRLAENSALRRALSEQDIEPAEASRLASPDRLIEALDVDAVLIGSVSEFGYQHGLHEEPVVGLNLRLVRAGADGVLWAASHSASGAGYFTRDSVNAAAQRVVREMVATLLKRSEGPSG